MRKGNNKYYLIGFYLVIFFYTIFAKDTGEFNLEIEYSKYVQNIVNKIIPNSFVSVKLELERDSTFFKNEHLNLDKKASLPGLPVANTTTYVPFDKNFNAILPAKIISRNITIFLPDDIKKEKIKLLKDQLSDILRLGVNDNLVTEYYKPLFRNKVKANINIFYVLTALFLLFIINFRSGMRYIAKTIRKSVLLAKQSGSSSIIFSNDNMASSKEATNKISNNQGILKVKLIRDKKRKEDSLDFSFLTDLQYDKILDLLKDEPIQDLPIILSVMPNDFCVYFCQNYPGPMDKLIESFYSIKKRPKIDLKLIRVSLYQKYISMLEKDTITFSGEQRLCDIVKQLPYSNANQILRYIKKVNSESFEKISKGIITLDKIKELNEIMIEEIVAQVDHTDFVKFLKIVDDSIKRKFYSTFSEEVIRYLEKEISEMEPLDEKEKNRITDKFINKLRELLEK